MSDRMPTTEEVREAYEHGAGILPPFYDPAHVHAVAERRADFDRWLAALIAEKQAEALEQATAMVTRGSAVTLRAIAQRLREQATNRRKADFRHTSTRRKT